MPKKDLSRVTADLSALANALPSQHITDREPSVSAAEAAPRAGTPLGEEVIQFSLSLRKSLRKELARLADDADLTMRAFVLLALRDKGLSVSDADLLDLRKGRGQ